MSKYIKEEIELFKKEYTETVKDILINTGSIPPTLTMLALNKEGKTGMVVAPIIADISINLDKQEIIENIIPKMSKEIKEKQLEVLCVCFSSEAYLRKLDLKDNKDKTTKELIELAKNVDPSETLMLLYESEDTTNSYVYDVKKSGKTINKEGELIDIIELENFRDLDENSTSNKGNQLFNAFKK